MHSGPICAFAYHFAAVGLKPMPLPLLHFLNFIERYLKSEQSLAKVGFEPGISDQESRVLTTTLAELLRGRGTPTSSEFCR